MLRREYFTAGLVYGFSVHFKIYPIIYSLPFYLFIDCDKKAILEGKTSTLDLVVNCRFFSKNRLTFAITSVITYLFFTRLFYHIYGYECLYESLLYHFGRKDNRHNYSIYWILIYQTYDLAASKVMAVLFFVPQWSVVFLVGLILHQDLFFAMAL